MRKKAFNNMFDALLSMQVGLIGRVAPSLRAVVVDLDIDLERYISYFFYDEPINDRLFDLASCAIFEACEDWLSDEHILQLDFPKPILPCGAFAYLRKEPGFSPPEISLFSRPSGCSPNPYLSYVLQQALLGRIVSSLRYVAVDVREKEKRIQFYFYYDEEITEELLTLSLEVITIAKVSFPSTFSCIEEIAYYPFPGLYPNENKRPVYERDEGKFSQL